MSKGYNFLAYTFNFISLLLLLLFDLLNILFLYPTGKEDQSKDRVFYTRRYKLNVNNHLKGMSTSVTSTAFHKRNKMMVTACETGDFLLFDMNDQGALIHSLNISSQVRIQGQSFFLKGEGTFDLSLLFYSFFINLFCISFCLSLFIVIISLFLYPLVPFHDIL